MTITGGGLFWYKYEIVNLDYKKYLGPDWVPVKKQPASIVCNHSVWIDILLSTYCNNFPRFTAKVGIKKWPLIGVITD